MKRVTFTLMAAAAAPLALLAATPANAQGFVCEDSACIDKRFAQDTCLPPAPGDSAEDGSERFMRWRPLDRVVDISDDGKTTRYLSGSAQFEEVNPFTAGVDLDPDDPFNHPEVPSNLLPTIYQDVKDCGGDPIPNTLPSTPDNPENLVELLEVESIDPTSQEQDLRLIIRRLEEAVNPRLRRATKRTFFPGGIGVPADPRRGGTDRFGDDAGTIEQQPARRLNPKEIRRAIDILEGNPVPDRVWSGMPLLNYVGPELVVPVECDETECVAEIHQVWSRQDIRSNAMFVDIPDEALNRPWKIRYTIDIVQFGEEDFAPYHMYFDDPQDVGGPGRPGVGMDATFFPMLPGKRYVLENAMPPGRFYSLTYHWGWRIHSPRIQALENSRKTPGGKNIVQWENEVFCAELNEDGSCAVFPRDNRKAQLRAISMIGDAAPAKRMWHALRALERKAGGRRGRDDDERGRGKAGKGRFDFIPLEYRRMNRRELIKELRAAFDDWNDRNALPRGFEKDPDADITMVYVNNTMYGEFTGKKRDMAQQRWIDWETRGEKLEVRLLNGDYFPHQYMNVDFGGNRGWENIFQNTLPTGGQGPWFTFGRNFWYQNIPCPAPVAAAKAFNDRARPYRKLGPLPDMDRGRGRDKLYAPESMMQPELQLCPDGAGTVVADWTEDGFGTHLVEITYRFEPNRRLRVYQFDPTHHNVAIWSFH